MLRDAETIAWAPGRNCVPSKADYYRAKAAECEEKAEAARDLRAKQMLKEAAQYWREMAAQAERLGW